MSIINRIAKLEAQTATGNNLCICPNDPNETWETHPPEQMALEWGGNLCQKCGQR